MCVRFRIGKYSVEPAEYIGPVKLDLFVTTITGSLSELK